MDPLAAFKTLDVKQHVKLGDSASAVVEKPEVIQELSPSGNHRLIVIVDGQAFLSAWYPAASVAVVKVSGFTYCGVSEGIQELPAVFVINPVEHTTRRI